MRTFIFAAERLRILAIFDESGESRQGSIRILFFHSDAGGVFLNSVSREGFEQFFAQQLGEAERPCGDAVALARAGFGDVMDDLDEFINTCAIG